MRGRGHRAVETHFPHPGWVEHDPEVIWQSVLEAAADAVADAGIAPRELRAIGITNQRETTVLWERRSSRPVGRAIVWQDRRTAERCARLPRELIRARTGLVPDPYFSATKLEWLLAQTPLRPDALAFGTVDSWLIWKLTDGRVHATDTTNASRTMLLDLDRLDLGRRAARAVLDRPLAAARASPVVGRDRRGAHPRPDAADRGHRGRSAGGALRPVLLPRGPGQGDLRHGQLRARARRDAGRPRARGAAQDRGRDRTRRAAPVRARGSDPRERLGHPVAARRARADRRRQRLGDARPARRLDRGRVLRPRADGPRLTALGSRRARPDQRHHPRERRASTSPAPRSRRSRSRSPT